MHEHEVRSSPLVSLVLTLDLAPTFLLHGRNDRIRKVQTPEWGLEKSYHYQPCCFSFSVCFFENKPPAAVSQMDSLLGID